MMMLMHLLINGLTYLLLIISLLDNIDNAMYRSTFTYIGSTLAENGHLDAEMTHRMQSGWGERKKVSGILCD